MCMARQEIVPGTATRDVVDGGEVELDIVLVVGLPPNNNEISPNIGDPKPVVAVEGTPGGGADRVELGAPVIEAEAALHQSSNLKRHLKMKVQSTTKMMHSGRNSMSLS